MEVILVPIVISIGFFAMVGYVVSVRSKKRQTEVRSIAEVQTKLLEKFGSSREFVDFLQTDGGKSFLSPVSENPIGPKERIVTSVKVGVITTSLGLALLILSVTSGESDMSIPGGLVLAVGIGFLLSAVVSYKLSKAWGMMSTADQTGSASNSGN